ncbi:hypothetical protein ACE2AJ_12875 [Aquihabitans daechungensis]|uniref:hypothetical protein n=1 Tax=Aquihabitans daechungensis TaxID=1052257 RepID=UPI003BA2AFFC
MSRRNPNRPRRIASQGTIRALRIFGWRYSTAREAWVHRALRGRVGPVFVDRDFDPHPELTDLSLFDAPRVKTPLLLAPEGERPPLPRRDTTPAPKAARVFARLADGEEPRVVVVDGRPPLRGVTFPEPVAEGVVVPIKSARATG